MKQLGILLIPPRTCWTNVWLESNFLPTCSNRVLKWFQHFHPTWCWMLGPFNPFTPRVEPRVNKCGCNFWVCGWIPSVWPFKWKLLSSTFRWCCLFLTIVQNEIHDFYPTVLNLALLGVKGLTRLGLKSDCNLLMRTVAKWNETAWRVD